jgi:hypothetical protein
VPAPLGDHRRAYSYFELECVLLFGRLLGKRTVRETLAALSGYKAAKTREEFGLDRPRDHVKTRYVKREDNLGLDGVPSEATMSRHIRKRFPEKLRTKLYLQCFLEIVIEHAEKYPEFARLLEALGADGSVMKSRHHPRMRTDENGNIVYGPDTGEVSMIPEGWEGGSLSGKSSDPEHKRPPAYLRGHGQMCVTVHTPDALPVGVEIGRLGADHETNLLLKIVEEQLPRVRKTMRPEAVPTVTTDGGFASQRTRRGLSEVGFVANSHDVGHGDRHLEHGPDPPCPRRRSCATSVRRANVPARNPALSRAVLDQRRARRVGARAQGSRG